MISTQDRSTDINTCLLETASSLFAQYGIKGVCMDDIAKAMSMSKRTIYERYSDKEELLIATIDYNICRRRDIMGKLKTDNNVLEGMLSFCTCMIDQADEYRYSSRFHNDIKRYPQALRRLEEDKIEVSEDFLKILTRGVEQGYFTPKVNYDILVMLTIETFMVRLSQAVVSKFSAKEVYRTVIFPYLRGICTPKGLEIFDGYFANNEEK